MDLTKEASEKGKISKGRNPGADFNEQMQSPLGRDGDAGTKEHPRKKTYDSNVMGEQGCRGWKRRKKREANIK